MDLKTQKQTKRIETHQSEIANGQGQISLRKAKLSKWEGREAWKRSLRLRIFRRIQKRICDLGSYGFFYNYQKKKGRSEKGSFTTTLTACLRAPRSEKNRGKKNNNNNKLIIAAKTSKKSNISTYEYTKCVLFRFETQTFLEWNTP